MKCNILAISDFHWVSAVLKKPVFQILDTPLPLPLPLLFEEDDEAAVNVLNRIALHR